MNKREARAILKCSLEIQKALDRCVKDLGNSTREYAQSYWAAHIASIAKGRGYGAMPIGTALGVVEGEGGNDP